MSNWTQIDELKHQLTHGPLIWPLLQLYPGFMNLERGSRFPFYTFPWVKKWGGQEDVGIGFFDNLVDAHEDERNTYDTNRSLHQRTSYVFENWFRLTNDTVANLTYETQLTTPQYDKLNSVIRQRSAVYYGALTGFHAISFMGLCYFLRYRKVGVLPCLGVSLLYTGFFSLTANIGYKLIVDNKVTSVAKTFGKDQYIQPQGSLRKLKY